MMGGRGTASGLASSAPQAAAPAPAPQAAAPAPAPQPAPAPARASGLVSDTGVQNMDDATLTALIQRAQNASFTYDGRQDTIAQRIADQLGLSQNVPELVSQEALAQYRWKTYEQGTLYRTVNTSRDGSKTGRQIAHELTSANDYGLNFGGGRAWGCGLYFAGTGPRGSRGAGARDSSGYGQNNPYTMEARFKSTARVATLADITGPTGRAWARSHRQALKSMGITVDSSGNTNPGRARGILRNDMYTIMAMLMGYDAYRSRDPRVPYYTVFNRGALQVARGNKYDRASNDTL